MKLLPRLFRLFCVLMLLGSAAIVINLLLIPSRNTATTHFDTIVVLGYPTNLDGTPSPEMRERVLEAVRQYKAGIAPHIIMTGADAHNHFIESHVMVALAQANGVPAFAVVDEPQALNTVQNIFYSAQVMREHAWDSAEIISSTDHVPRVAMVATAFNKEYPRRSIEWRTHPAPWPAEYSVPHRLARDIFEAARCLELRIFGFPPSTYLLGN